MLYHALTEYLALNKTARKDIEKLHDPTLMKRLTAIVSRSHLNDRSTGKPLRSHRERRLRSLRIGPYRAIIEPLAGGDTIVAFGNRSDIYQRLRQGKG